jgi:hypothetical protein
MLLLDGLVYGLSRATVSALSLDTCFFAVSSSMEVTTVLFKYDFEWC